MITVRQFRRSCGCRAVGECTHNLGVELEALDALVKQFGAALRDKLHRKYLRDGRTGWDDPSERAFFQHALREHIDKGDMLDVAAFAMFLWNLPPAPTTPKETP